MSTATQDPTDREDIREGELEFATATGRLLLFAAVDAYRRATDVDSPPRAELGDFMRFIIQGTQRLERIHRENGERVEEDALRVALDQFERAVEVRKWPGRINEMIKHSDVDLGSAAAFHACAASRMLDWAVIGAYERLAELEDKAA